MRVHRKVKSQSEAAVDVVRLRELRPDLFGAEGSGDGRGNRAVDSTREALIDERAAAVTADLVTAKRRRFWGSVAFMIALTVPAVFVLLYVMFASRW